MDYLRVTCQGLRGLLPLSVVEELVRLPELTVVPEAPADIIGVMNLRGELVPVMHLGCRLGITHPQCQDTDVIIVIQHCDLRVGVLVNQVNEVVSIAAEVIFEEPDYGHPSEVNTAFVAGLAKIQEELAVVMNVERLIREPTAVAEFSAAVNLEELDNQEPYDFYCRYWPTATPLQQALLRERREQLSEARRAVAEDEQQLSVVVFELGGEFFALPSTEIRQFIELKNVVPIPGAAPPLVGHLHLQGEIMPLIDLRPLLHLSEHPIPLKSGLVVEVDSMMMAILVEGIQGIMNYAYQDMQLSSFLSVHENAYVGSIVQEGKVIKLLSLKQLLSKLLSSSVAA